MAERKRERRKMKKKGEYKEGRKLTELSTEVNRK